MESDSDTRRWIEESVEAGRIIGINDARVRESFAVVLNAFGEKWLRTELARCDPGKYGGLLAGHPLVHKLRMGQPPQVSAVVELATYLAAFQQEPDLVPLVQRMKDPLRYSDAILELAVAFRYRSVGAKCEFQPPTASGLADFRVQYGAETWIVECSKQSPAEQDRGREALRNQLGHSILKAVEVNEGTPCAIRVVVQSGATQAIASSIARSLRQLVRQVDQRPWNRYEHKDALYSVDVERFSESEHPEPSDSDEPWVREWDLIAQNKRVPKSYADNFPKDVTGPIPGLQGHRLYLRIDGDSRDVERALLGKIDKKLKQTKDKLGAPPRFIIIEVSARLHGLDWERIRAHLAKLFSSRSRLAGISLCNRRYNSQRGRYWYEQMVHTNDAGGYPLCSELYLKLTELELAFVY